MRLLVLKTYRWGNRFNFKQFVLPEDWGVVMKLIERMVGDDYTVNIQIIPCPQPRYIMEAKRSNGRGYQLTLSHPTFPAAIVELFCRVFDIKED